MTKSIPRFILFGHRNLNLIEKMDLMRIDIFFMQVPLFKSTYASSSVPNKKSNFCFKV